MLVMLVLVLVLVLMLVLMMLRLLVRVAAVSRLQSEDAGRVVHMPCWVELVLGRPRPVLHEIRRDRFHQLALDAVVHVWHVELHAILRLTRCLLGCLPAPVVIAGVYQGLVRVREWVCRRKHHRVHFVERVDGPGRRLSLLEPLRVRGDARLWAAGIRTRPRQ